MTTCHLPEITHVVASAGFTFVGFHAAAVVEYSRMETVPSDEPTARNRPSSCGAQLMLLMDAVCRVAGVIYTCN